MTAAISRFLGRLIALFVHELNNHLATLGETSGLGSDILKTRSLSEKEKLKEIEKLIDGIENRIGNSTSLVRTFGNLGMGLETPAAASDLNQVLHALMPFFSKIARQKSIVLTVSMGRSIPAIAVQSVPLQCLVFALFENLCSSVDLHAAVRIATETSGPAVMLNMESDRPPSADVVVLPWAEQTIEMLAASIGSKIGKPWPGALTLTIERLA